MCFKVSHGIAGCFRCEKKALLSLKTKVFQIIFQPNEAFDIFTDFLCEFEIVTEDRLKGEQIARKTKEWKPPKCWCFGDFGGKNGQLEYPSDILVNEEGEE